MDGLVESADHLPARIGFRTSTSVTVPFRRFRCALVTRSCLNEVFDTHAFLDSGCERSLFDGEMAGVLGIARREGRRVRFLSNSGAEVAAMLHKVRFSHPEIGSFELEVGFTESRIHRCLLGRDFFDLFQIGFRERYLEVYLAPISG